MYMIILCIFSDNCVPEANTITAAATLDDIKKCVLNLQKEQRGKRISIEVHFIMGH